MPVVEEILESSLLICEQHEQGQQEEMQSRPQPYLGGNQKPEADEPGEGR